MQPDFLFPLCSTVESRHYQRRVNGLCKVDYGVFGEMMLFADSSVPSSTCD
jgi:hypothetical protein